MEILKGLKLKRRITIKAASVAFVFFRLPGHSVMYMVERLAILI